ncbi:MAG: 4Fe-4S binding protein [Spirochaetales bacterium]|nr:4Fe-4S binding protein [Spirochaetales bacterium]
MFLENKTMYIKRTILTHLARFHFKDTLIHEINRLPLEIVPKDASPYRCCVHKDRAIIKYRTIALLGFSLENEFEIDQLLLSEYANLALAREKPGFPILTFIDEACRSCVRANYVVTNMCRNCVARPCIVNCPKDAISKKEGHAFIDSEKCINCGKCMAVCPFHAIIYIPVPCEESCPVGAISKDEKGRENIDYNKCIFCGKCIRACPFGAVMEKSQVVDVINIIKRGNESVAMIAPSIIGQFNTTIHRIAGALKQIGFTYIVEVALGADVTIEEESKEFLGRLKKGEKLMGTSCCPAYIEAVKKHAQAFLPYVSDAETPMAYTAHLSKEKFPRAKRIFIGPCVAKKHEDLSNEIVDYVLTFEELVCLLDALNIDIEKCDESELDIGVPTSQGRGFPQSGGVAAAIQHRLKGECDVKPVFINGFTRQSVKLLNRYGKEGCPGNLVEVMSCEGGCMGGPAVIAEQKKGSNRLETFLHQPVQKEDS